MSISLMIWILVEILEMMIALVMGILMVVRIMPMRVLVVLRMMAMRVLVVLRMRMMTLMMVVGGLLDPLKVDNISILAGYRGYVAYKIWKNEELEVLQSNTRFKILSSWELPNGDEWVSKVKETRLIHLSTCMFEHLNMSMISAFVEMWHPETNILHMPFRKMSITLHEVAYILGLKIDGCVVHHGETNGDNMKASLSRCLCVPLSTLSLRGEIMKSYAIKLAIVKVEGQKLGGVGS